jgi:hypothetical protein
MYYGKIYVLGLTCCVLGRRHSYMILEGPTLANPRNLWSRQIRDGETIACV